MERDSGRERDCRGCRGVSACLTEVGEENERQKERERERERGRFHCCGCIKPMRWLTQSE